MLETTRSRCWSVCCFGVEIKSALTRKVIHRKSRHWISYETQVSEKPGDNTEKILMCNVRLGTHQPRETHIFLEASTWGCNHGALRAWIFVFFPATIGTRSLSSHAWASSRRSGTRISCRRQHCRSLPRYWCALARCWLLLSPKVLTRYEPALLNAFLTHLNLIKHVKFSHLIETTWTRAPPIEVGLSDSSKLPAGPISCCLDCHTQEYLN